ncbi:hypothetical protein, partial [Mesorhizobium sp. M4A.F.Ca.ET.020.02.1.1]|uniref:hypothetical protein n=1 Tax=Mesorhizobium sp. M4A.F.Ca.ET.020.02.1.1 TaxID=2496652 RepID=UPI001AECFF7D
AIAALKTSRYIVIPKHQKVTLRYLPPPKIYAIDAGTGNRASMRVPVAVRHCCNAFGAERQSREVSR